MIADLEAPVREVVEDLLAKEPHLTPTILRNWSEWPCKPGNYLWGDVENHPRLGNMKGVRTSRVRYINETIGLAVTKNTIYILKDKLES